MAHRNSEFYSQDIIFHVEDELFKVSKHLLVQHSQVFRDMFNIPQPEGIELDGSSDERPLILEGIEKQDFIQLLRYFYPQFQRAAGDGFSLDHWKSVLKLSNLYEMIEVKKLVVDNMTPLLKGESPSLQIHLAQVHDVSKWLEPAKTGLVERSNPINEDDVQLIGQTIALEVCALREKALQERALREKTLQEKALSESAIRERALQDEVLRGKTALENALRESAIVERVLRENMSQEKLDNMSFQKNKKKPSKNTDDWIS